MIRRWLWRATGFAWICSGLAVVVLAVIGPHIGVIAGMLWLLLLLHLGGLAIIVQLIPDSAAVAARAFAAGYDEAAAHTSGKVSQIR